MVSTLKRILLFALFCSLNSYIQARPLKFRFSNPLPHGNSIIGLFWDGDRYWEAGERGQVYTSTDLDNWFPGVSGTTNSLRSITRFGSRIFISGERGIILYGDDPRALQRIDLGTEDWLEGIACSATQIVAVGDNGSIYSSHDGTNWSPRGNFNAYFRAVAYGADRFVVVGEDGHCVSSTDGIAWTAMTTGTTAHLNSVAFLHDRFWIAGGEGTVLTNDSQFALKRVSVPTTNNLIAVTGNTEEILLAGDQVLLLGNQKSQLWSSQTDATNPDAAPIWPYYSALWDGRLFLVGGRTGMKVEGFRTNSASPLVWTTHESPARAWLWSVTRQNDLYVTVGTDGTILSSFNGITWYREVAPEALRDEVLLGVGGNSNMLIVVGSGGKITYSPNLFTNSISTNLNGELLTNSVSLFGLAWHEAISPVTNTLQAITFERGIYIVGGAKGTILTSSSGTRWFQQASPVSTFLSGAAGAMGLRAQTRFRA